MYSGPDRWIYPIRLQGTWVLEYDDGIGTDFTIEFSPGYYLASKGPATVTLGVGEVADHAISVSNNDGRLPLLTAIEVGVNSQLATADEISIVSATPVVAGVDWSGIEVVSDTAATLTISPMAGDVDDATTVARMLGIDGDSIDVGEKSDHSLWGVWSSRVSAQDKRPTSDAMAFSGDGSRTRYANRWKSSPGRRFHYFDIPAESVRSQPAVFGAPADDTDPNDHFVDLWRVGSESGKDVIVIHGTGFDENASLDYTDHDWEAVRLRRPESFSSAGDVISDLGIGERYEVQMVVDVVESEWSE